MKKLEPGCTAVVIGANDPVTFEANVGKIVKVLRYIGEHRRYFEKDLWEIDIPVLCPIGKTFGKTENYGTAFVESERYLQRIDDEEIKETCKEEECQKC